MADSVIIKLDGDDSSYSKVLSLAEKKAKETAEKARKAVDEANKAMQKAAEETNAENKKLAEEAVRLARDTSDKAIAEAERAQRELKKVQDELGKQQTEVMNKNAEGVAVINSGAKKVALAGAAAAAAVVGIGVNYNSQMEQYMAGFSTMLGNAEKAQDMMNDLKDFAASTPFEMTDLADASTTLLAFGEDVNELMPDLKMLGDISLGNKEKFKSLALVFGQVQSQGKLMGQDLLQMINAGFNPLQIISEKTGKSMADLKEEMSDGAISFEMVADAMKTATSEGGQFFNAMEAQSQTAKGQLSTLKDNVTALFGEMSESASEILAEDILPKAIELVEYLNEKLQDGTLEKWFKTGAVGAAAFGGAIGAMNLALLVKDLQNVITGVKGYTAATKLGTTAQKLHNASLLASPYTWVVMGLAAVVAGLVAYDMATESTTEKIQKNIDALNEINETYDDTIRQIEEKQAAEEAEALKVEALANQLYDYDKQLKNSNITGEEAARIKKELNAVASQLESIIPGITSSLYNETGAIDVQKGAVEKLITAYINLAKAKAMVNAYQAKLDETYKAMADAKVQYKKDKELVTQTKETLDEYNSGEKRVNQIVYLTAKDNYADAKTAAKKTLDSYKGFKNDIDALSKELTSAVAAEIEAQSAYDAIMPQTNGGYSGGGTAGGSSGSKSKEKTAEQLQKEAEREAEKAARDIEQAAREAEQQRQAAYQKELRDLKFQKDMEYITEADYYDKIAELRDKYFVEGDAEWQQHTLEIKQYEDSLVEDAKRQREEEQQQKMADYQKELRDLNYYKDMGLKSEQEYYSDLAKLRDKYFTESDNEWQQLTLSIENYFKATKDKVIDTWETAIDDIASQRDSIADGLKAENKGYQTYTFHTGEGTETYTALADLSADNRKLEQYTNLLNKYKEKASGEIPSQVVNQLKNMSPDEAIKYLTALLNSTDEQFQKQIDDIKRNDLLSKGIAETLIAEDAEELKKQFEQAFAPLPPKFFELGEENGEEFGKGFKSAFNEIMEGIRASAESKLDISFSGIAVNSASATSGGNTYNDNRSTTWNLSGTSPRAAMEMFKANQTYQKHTSKMGG